MEEFPDNHLSVQNGKLFCTACRDFPVNNPETGELAPQMQLLKVARLCHPIRLRELRPPAEQLDELFQFKVIPMSQCRV